MQLAELLNLGRKPCLPLSVKIDSGELTLVSWLRTLPKKRYVARAIWTRDGVETPVLAKLYFGARAVSSMASEREGSERLIAAGLRSPSVVHYGAERQSAWLLFDWLPDAVTLAEQLNLQVDSCDTLTQTPGSLLAVVGLIRSMHEQSMQQADIHPDNFIFSQQQWHIIDAADIGVCDSAAARECNLGVFLAQLPHAWWSDLIGAYSGVNEDDIVRYAREHRLWRARDLAAKSQRDCTLFSYQQNFYRWTSLWRNEYKAIMPLLDDIEEAMAAGTMLKDGGSSTVVLVQWQGRPLVIKRYNIKGLGHFLRRCLRPSRASHSWQQGHLWRVLELPTARPVAVLEKRWGPLRLGGYLVAEYSSEQDIIDAFSEDRPDLLIAALQQLLQRMADYQVSHGDLKGTNVLIEQEKVSFIDLDAAQQHVNVNGWRRAFVKDLSRLQRNWPVTSACYNALTSMLERVKQRVN